MSEEILWDSSKAIETGFAGIELIKGDVQSMEKIKLQGKPEYGGKDKERVRVHMTNVEVLKTQTPIELLKMPEDGTFDLYIPYSNDKRYFWTKCFLPAYEGLGTKLPDDAYETTVFKRTVLPLGGGFEQRSYVPVIVGKKVAKGFDLDEAVAGEAVEETDPQAELLALADGKTEQQFVKAVALDSKLKKFLPEVKGGTWVKGMIEGGLIKVVKGVIKVVNG